MNIIKPYEVIHKLLIDCSHLQSANTLISQKELKCTRNFLIFKRQGETAGRAKEIHPVNSTWLSIYGAKRQGDI